MSYALQAKLKARGIELDIVQCDVLRRAGATLQRCAARECNEGASALNDQAEQRAMRRALEVCKNHRVTILGGATSVPLYAYYQSDPRGPALWVAPFPLNDSNYLQGVACT